MFYLFGILLLSIPVILLIPAMGNRRSVIVDNPQKQNALIAKQRIDEAKSQIGESDSKIVLSEIQQDVEETLVDDLRTQQPIPDRVIAPWKSGTILVVFLLISIPVYLQLGSTNFISTSITDHSDSEQQSESTPDVAELLRQLEERIEEDPDNPKGLELAGRTYMSLGEFSKAEAAFAQLNVISPGNPDFLSSWADSSIMASGNVYTDTAKESVIQALKLDPMHVNSLWIAALGSSSKGDYEAGNIYFNRLLPLVDADPNLVSNIQSLITANLEKISASASQSESPTTVQNLPAKSIQTRVEINSEIVGKLNQYKAVFIIARAANGPPAPLAVSKHQPEQFPLDISLTSEMSMIPGMDIDAFERIEIVARLSKSGNPQAQPGDYESKVVLIDSDNQDLRHLLKIDKLAE
jgi:cytochrome c-type biogenesis protein CcmH